MSRGDLKSFCEVSKRLNAVLTFYFYELIIISIAELFMAGLISIIENISFARMKYTKGIWIKTSFYKWLITRCLYRDDYRFSDEAGF